MNIDKLADFYAWADIQVRESIQKVSDDDFVKDTSEGRSLRQLIEHYVNSYEYLTFTGDFKERMAQLAMMSREDLMISWEEAADGFLQVLRGLNEEEYNLSVGKEETISLERGLYVLVYTDHQSYHRGNIATKLRELGYKPHNSDLYTFITMD